MKVIHIIDYFQPKLGYQETFLAREHAKLGYDVYVVTADRYNPNVYSENKQLLGNRIKGAGFFVEDGIKVWRLKTLFELPHAIWTLGLRKKIIELNPDIVIVHGITNFFALRTARLKGKTTHFNLIYDEHMTFANSTSKMRILYPLFRLFLASSIQKAADALVAILPESKRFMEQRYGMNPERITIIPLGADDELFRFDINARREVRKELAIKEDDVVFLYSGKVIARKKLHLLVEAAAQLMANHENVRVIFVGSGLQSYIEKLKQAIKSKELEDKFVWHETVSNEQLFRFYSAADAAVWPFEASIGMREAMACGLPIIIGEDSRVAELVAYNNGFLYQEGDTADLAEKMEKLLDPELRQEMGHNSRKLVEDRFNWRTIAQQFIELAPEPRREL